MRKSQKMINKTSYLQKKHEKNICFHHRFVNKCKRHSELSLNSLFLELFTYLRT